MLNSRMPDDDSNDITVIVVAGLSLAGVFLLDVATPLGLAVWVFYLLPLGLCLLQTRPAVPLIAAALISVFALAGLLLSAPGPGAGGAFAVGASNRFIGIIVVWGLAWLAHRMIRTRAELRETAWVREGEARVHRCLVADNDPAKLAHEITTELCRYVGAAGGAMYSLDGDSLRLLGGYALGERMRARERIPIGEGLAGEVLAHGRTATLIGLPESYFELTSATGSADARALIVVPITAETRICGVLEIAFIGNARWVSAPALRRFSGLLEEVADAVGMSLRAAQMRDDLVELLEETQRQGEELQAQQDDLRSSNEELEKQGQTMRETQTLLERQQAALEQANSRLEDQKARLLQTRQELQDKAAALEQASRFKSEFLANMSHELRTPLNSALILARLLADNPGGNLSADQVRYAKTIHDANSDLLMLIDDILDLSKIEAGRIELSVEPTPLDPVLRSIVAMFEPVAQERGLHFRTDLGAANGLSLNTDAMRLQQILRNLLSNAFKFTEHGEVALHVSPGTEGHLRFVVRDTGIGIHTERQQLIFEAFRQEDGSTNRRFGGTGLGLSISRNLAEQLGGRLWLESAAGKGSSFFLELPVDGPSASATSADSPTVSETAPPGTSAVDDATPQSAGDARPDVREARRVLLVSDTADLRATLQRLLRVPQLELLEAETPAHALTAVDQHSPDCVVLEFGPANTPGHALLEALAERERALMPPIIVHSSQPLSSDDEARLRRHAECIIIKGARSAERLLEEVMLILERTGSARESPRSEGAVRARDAMFDGRRILLAEDDMRNVFALVSAFEPLGVVFDVARNGREAVERVAAGKVDLVLMDLMMPEMDGLEAIRRIRALEAGRNLPIIALTAKARPDDRQNCLDAGANDYMAKPVDLTRLLALCRVWLPK